jgi:hypothetical protein
MKVWLLTWTDKWAEDSDNLGIFASLESARAAAEHDLRMAMAPRQWKSDIDFPVGHIKWVNGGLLVAPPGELIGGDGVFVKYGDGVRPESDEYARLQWGDGLVRFVSSGHHIEEFEVQP